MLKNGIANGSGKVDIIVKCFCLLHNIIIDKEGLTSLEIPMEATLEGNESISRRYNNYSRNASESRKAFKNYFVNPVGEVQFQYNIL